MKKKRMIALDADYLLFMCTEGKQVKTGGFSPRRTTGFKAKKAYKEPLKPYKEKMKRLIQDVEDEISANMVGEVKGIKPIFSDPKGNFRYKLAPDYKAGRPPRSELWYRLHKWALKKYGFTNGIEADDEVAYLVLKKNWIGASMDKDLWKGIEGDWFNVYHTKRYMHYCSPMDARNFNLIQTLTGDSDDNIKALPKKYGDPMIDGVRREGQRKPYKVTEKIATELLDEFGWDWQGVVDIFKTKGFGEEEAILNRRLICMRQWSPKKGVQLWLPPKKGVKLFTPPKH